MNSPGPPSPFKATNAEAAAPALAAYPRVRWIVGGQAKAETLGDSAPHLDHVAQGLYHRRGGADVRAVAARGTWSMSPSAERLKMR